MERYGQRSLYGVYPHVNVRRPGSKDGLQHYVGHRVPRRSMYCRQNLERFRQRPLRGVHPQVNVRRAGSKNGLRHHVGYHVPYCMHRGPNMERYGQRPV